ncbi:hypothetical protein SUDANB1_00193 [Streptomyces sp. enrichment culture]|uniref:hypothetical protein n=1 Tax=Streptomyces sp. enrichment culture TaxID=1795815 RepID=UPI003F5543AF
MAVARLDLTATAVRIRLAITGISLAVLGHGCSFLALHLVPGALNALGESGWARRFGRAGLVVAGRRHGHCRGAEDTGRDQLQGLLGRQSRDRGQFLVQTRRTRGIPLP